MKQFSYSSKVDILDTGEQQIRGSFLVQIDGILVLETGYNLKGQCLGSKGVKEDLNLSDSKHSVTLRALCACALSCMSLRCLSPVLGGELSRYFNVS